MITINSHPLTCFCRRSAPSWIVLGVIGLLLWVPSVLWAQKDSGITSQEQELSSVLRVQRNLVGVRAVVRDAKGHAVGDLKREDFQLLDNGKTQIISNFSIEHPSAGGETAAPGEAGEANLPARPADRFLAILFDDVHAGQGDLNRVSSAAEQFLSTALRPRDRIAVFTTSGHGELDFTSDLGELREAIHNLVPRPTLESKPCPDISGYEAYLIVEEHDPDATEAAYVQLNHECATLPKEGAAKMGSALGDYLQSKARQIVSSSEIDARHTFDVMNHVVERLAERPGERTLLLVSPGFFDRRQAQTLDPVIDRALRAGVVINALNIIGLASNPVFGAEGKVMPSGPELPVVLRIKQLVRDTNEEPLIAVADGTGGNYFHNNNDFVAGFRSTLGLAEVSYLLGFTPSEIKYDGKFHEIKVKLANASGYSVQARRGYFALTEPPTVSQQAEDQIRAAIFSTEESKILPFIVSTKFFKPDSRVARLTVRVRIDAHDLAFRDEKGSQVDELRITTIVFDNSGKLVDGKQRNLKMRLNEPGLAKLRELPGGLQASVDLDLAPGNYRLREVVFDTNSGKVGTANQALEIPF